MKNFKSFAHLMLVVCLSMFSLISCIKDDDLIQEEQNSDLASKAQVESKYQTMAATATSILSATSAWDIPTQFFKANQVYKNNYIYLKQKTGECSWTNYVLNAGAIARAKGYSYPATYAQVTAVKNWTGSNALITKLNQYRSANDASKVSGEIKSFSKNSTGRFNMVKQMINHLDTRKTPFIALASYSGIGHYYIVWSIDWKVGGTGSEIWFTNTLDPVYSSFDTQVRNMNFSDFLDLMEDNPDASYYNSLFLW